MPLHYHPGEGRDWGTSLKEVALRYRNLSNWAPASAGVEVIRESTLARSTQPQPTPPALHSPQTAYGLRLVNLMRGKECPVGGRYEVLR